MIIKKISIKKICWLFSMGLFLLAALRFRNEQRGYSSATIRLKWYKAYEKETWQNVKTGVLWSFSYMGAMLPKGSFDSSLIFKDSSLFELNLASLGFSKKALMALATICDSIKNTPDYQHNQFIDLTRFLVLTLYSPYNYYQITEALPSLINFKTRYNLNNPLVFGVTKSSVNSGHRIIKFSRDTSLFNIGFIAEEGRGSLLKGTFKPRGFEVFDFMANGQLRYAIYNKNGELVPTLGPTISNAGKPGKCMWCHELYIQPLFSENTAVAGMMDNASFMARVRFFQKKLDNYRKTLNCDIDFGKKQDHTQSELLYISFMEPSLYRLSNEFRNDSALLKKISGQATHIYDEFPFLGKLYHRRVVDRSFSYQKIAVPNFVREKSGFEPQYFKPSKALGH